MWTVQSVVVVALVLGLAACGGGDPPEDERQQAIDAAMAAWSNASEAGESLAEGPCIAEDLSDATPDAPAELEDWVADVAHDPREDVDDEPENQCERFREGEAEHFVELTPDGELIRAE